MPSPLPRRKLFHKWFIFSMLGFIGGGILSILTVPAGWVLFGALSNKINLCSGGQSSMGCLFLGATLAGGLTVGLSVGFAQWLIIRRFLQRAKWWVLASMLGWMGIAFGLSILFYSPLISNGTGLRASIRSGLPSILPLLSAGALMGLFQGLHMEVPLVRAWTWIVLHVFLMLLTVLAVTSGIHPGGGLTGASVFLLLSSPIYAATSAAVFSRLIGKPKVLDGLGQAT